MKVLSLFIPVLAIVFSHHVVKSIKSVWPANWLVCGFPSLALFWHPLTSVGRLSVSRDNLAPQKVVNDDVIPEDEELEEESSEESDGNNPYSVTRPPDYGWFG